VGKSYIRRSNHNGQIGAVNFRGLYESNEHRAFKDGIAKVKKLGIIINNKKILIEVEHAETEKNIIVQEREYEVDVHAHIVQSEQTNKFFGNTNRLNIEVFHTAKVTYEKAEDFILSNNNIYEVEKQSSIAK